MCLSHDNLTGFLIIAKSVSFKRFYYFSHLSLHFGPVFFKHIRIKIHKLKCLECFFFRRGGGGGGGGVE